MSKTPKDSAPLNQDAELMDIPFDKVIVTPDRLRGPKSHRIEVLVQDIDMNGPHTTHHSKPVTWDICWWMACSAWRPTPPAKGQVPAYVLGRDHEPARIRYTMIMSNINRESLTMLERAEYIAELDAAWKEMNPAARHGGDRRSAKVRLVKEQHADDDEAAILAVSNDVAAKTGLTKRVFQQCVQIANGCFYDEKIKTNLIHFENNHNFLLNFARTPREHHHAILDMILDVDHPAKTIEEALIVIRGGALNKDTSDQAYQRAVVTLSKLEKKDRKRFFVEYKEEIIALAKSEGWL